MQIGELAFENLYDDGQSFWFTERDYNALFRMDKEDWSPELVGIFPGEAFLQKSLYSAMAFCNGKLYFAPFFAKEIAEYDLAAKAFRKIPVPMPHMSSGRPWENGKFSNIALEGKNIYFIPFAYPGILCYDTETGAFKCFDGWVGQIERIRINEWGYFRAFAWAGRRLALPCICGDAAVIFDAAEEKSWIVGTPATGYLCRHTGIFYADHYFYLVSADGTVSKRKLNSREEDIRTIRIPVSGKDGIELHPMQYADGYIYLFPSKNSKGFKLDTRTGEVAPMEIFEDEKRFEGDNPLYLCCGSDGKRLYALTGNSRRFLAYDLCRGDQRSSALTPSGQDRHFLEKLRRDAFVTRLCQEEVMENEDEPLAYMLEILQGYNSLKGSCDGRRETEAGSKIYHMVIHGE